MRKYSEKDRMKAAQLVRLYVDTYKIPPRVLAPLLGVSFTSVYRWAGLDSIIFADAEILDSLSRLDNYVAPVRAAYEQIVSGWGPVQRAYPEQVKAEFFNPEGVAIIENAGFKVEEKINRLLAQHLRGLAAAAEKFKGVEL